MSDTKTINNIEDKSDEEVIDLKDNENYQILSHLFETESGKNIADLLSKIQKDIHLLATSVSKLIEIAIKSHVT